MGSGRRSPLSLAVGAFACVLSALLQSIHVPLLEGQHAAFCEITPPCVGHRAAPSRARATAKVVAKAFDAATASASALTRMIKQARTPADLWAVSAAPECDLVHRATILFDLAEMAKKSRDPVFTAGSEGAASFQDLLRRIIKDLRFWKASGNLKAGGRGKADVVVEQAHYLGNLIWSLGALKSAISEVLPASEYTILFDSAVLAALEGVQDFMRSGRTMNVLQILFGLRGVGRTFQSDALYSSVAPGLLQLIQEHGSERDKGLGHSLLAFGSYGLRDTAITKFFVDAKDNLKGKTWGQNAQDLVQFVKGFALYAHRCVHPTPDPTNFAVSLIKGDGQKLGIKMQSERGEPGLVISKITEGLVKRWNRLNPEWRIKEGDRIVNANGVNGSAANISKEILGEPAVTMVLQRGQVALRVSDRPVRDGKVPVGVRDEALMQALGQRLAPLFEEEKNVFQRTKLTTNAIMSYILLGIRSEPIFRGVTDFILRDSQAYVSSYVCVLLWGLGKMDVGSPEVVKVLVKRATSLLSRDQVQSEEMPVLYHALKRFGYPRGCQEVQQLVDVARSHGMTVEHLEVADGTPSSWA